MHSIYKWLTWHNVQLFSPRSSWTGNTGNLLVRLTDSELKVNRYVEETLKAARWYDAKFYIDKMSNPRNRLPEKRKVAWYCHCEVICLCYTFEYWIFRAFASFIQNLYSLNKSRCWAIYCEAGIRLFFFHFNFQVNSINHLNRCCCVCWPVSHRERRAQEIISLLSLKNSVALCFCVLALKHWWSYVGVYACVCLQTVGREHENGKNNTKNWLTAVCVFSSVCIVAWL